jgi:hypothetical protein
MDILYLKLRIINGRIGYQKKMSFIESEWIPKYVTMHPLINVLMNLSNFIENI